MRITVRTNSAAFNMDAMGQPELETANILRRLADRLVESGMPAPGDPIVLRDHNGNPVGKAEGH